MRPRVLLALARSLVTSTALVAFATLGACAAAPKPSPTEAIDHMRSVAVEAPDGEALGRLLLGELFAPGGDASHAVAARKRLDALEPAKRTGLFASLARAIDDEIHGRFQSAATGYLDTLVASRSSDHVDAPLCAWFAAQHLLQLRSGIANLWERARGIVLETMDHPGNIGWRARGELVEWRSLDAREETKPDASGGSTGPLELTAKRYGCLDKAKMAGPFGHLGPADHRTHFDAERAGPWPTVFARDPLRLTPPRSFATEHIGCALHPVGAVEPGVFYVETFIDMPAERDVIVSVQAALAIFVDDTEVLTRDTRQWGIWPRFGALLRLGEGRHRIVARVAGTETSVRVVSPEGVPIDAPSSDDEAPPYSITPPTLLADPNILAPFLDALGVPPQPGTEPRSPRRDTNDPIARVLAAYLAHVEGQEDVSSVLLEPLVKDQAIATGPALALEAVFCEKDPIYPEGDAHDLAKDLRARASVKDAELWWPRFWLALDEADKGAVSEVAPKLTELADHFKEVPEILKGLATVFAKTGWKVEHDNIVKEAAKRFPDDVEALQALLHLYDEEGLVADADKVAARILELDPDDEVAFQRAIERRDFRAAIRELERLRAIRKDRRDVAARIADLLARAGMSKESMKTLEAAVQKSVNDGAARLALADARFASGDHGALQKGLLDAIQTGADTAPLRDAIELVDGITELSSYRLDGKKVIAEYEASGQTLPGTAARVLDYSALWVHPDGSARMLEHEIIAIQSREGIQEHAEQQLPRGLVLKIRTIKHDGRVLEPEIVEGKATVTMPHLEVGDYIETESVTTLRGDGQGGQRFEGPRWFFREEKIPYWRSEFITISPKTRPLEVETGGSVPKPEVTERGALVIRKWRVDQSPALPEEPGSAPIQEFLPNVRVGWGLNLADAIARTVDAATDETPRDPRIARIARGIIEGTQVGNAVPAATTASAEATAPKSIDERARRIYRWVLSNVEVGRETDPRRIILGKSGNRAEAFLHLCRLSGIEASLGLVRDRLAPPPIGPMSESELFGSVAVRVVGDNGPRWMVVRDKFAPYGYLPSSLRGQPAVILTKGAPRETTTSAGGRDGVSHEGTVELAADGSATITLEQHYAGKLAILLRTALETLPDARLKETIEGRLLPQSFPGARVLSVDVKNLAEIDEPLVLAMKLEMATFARARDTTDASGPHAELVLSAPFPMFLSGLATLPSRETPLYLSEQVSTTTSLKLDIKLPDGAQLTTSTEPITVEAAAFVAKASDRMVGGTLSLERFVDLPAGRVLPSDYAAFQAAARRADAALHHDLVISLVKLPHL